MDTMEEDYEEELLANALYIFLLLVMCATALGGVAFGLREYLLSPRASAPVVKDTLSPPTVPVVKETLPPPMVSDAAKAPDPILVAIEPKEIDESVALSPKTTPFPSLKLQPSLKPPPKLDVVPDHSPVAGGSVSQFLNSKFSSPHMPPSVARTCYTLEQLYSWNPTSTSTNLYTHPVALNIPHTDFDSAYAADKAIHECLNQLALSRKPNSNASGQSAWVLQMAVAPLLSFGYASPQNANYFLTSFHSLMVYLIDSANLFDLLGVIGAVALRNVVTVCLAYCTAHWRYRATKRQRVQTAIESKFGSWNCEPAAIGQLSVLRLLLNLELGFQGVQVEQSIVAGCRSLARQMCLKLYCNDYLGFLPLLAQAIHVTEVSEHKIPFYELVLIIVKRHSICCMADYIGDRQTDLKLLVQHGFWNRHCFGVNEIANAICLHVSSQGYNGAAWMKEAEHGKCKIAAAPREGTAQEAETKTQQDTKKAKELATPGSWSEAQLKDSESTAEGKIKRLPSLRQFGFQ